MTEQLSLPLTRVMSPFPLCVLCHLYKEIVIGVVIYALYQSDRDVALHSVADNVTQQQRITQNGGWQH